MADSNAPIPPKQRFPALLAPIGYHTSHCGYCKNDDSGASYYVNIKHLDATTYQVLMDRGWRRSGALMYLPDASRACCPHYTIRLPVEEFKPTRDQRQALNRWNRHVLGEKYVQELAQKYPKTKQQKKADQNQFDLISTIHESESSYLKPAIQPAHLFEVTLEPDKFTEEKYALFDNYQRHAHHEGDDDISRDGFRRFLCSSPLHSQESASQHGSFHQCYRLDGRLVAMGVLDILPHAVSAVYFIYHSDMTAWSFGKLSALREATLALERNLGYYYMGYYIHSCAKMRYKADYRPQMVLDIGAVNDYIEKCRHGRVLPMDRGGCTERWHPLDAAMMSLMDRRKWVSMKREQDIRESNHSKETNGDNDDINDDSENSKRTDEIPDNDESAAEEAYAVPVEPTASGAETSGASLLKLGMPGVLTADELQSEVDLDNMFVYLGRRGSAQSDDGANFLPTYAMSDLVAWESGEVLDPRSLKGFVAELAAALGPQVAKIAVVSLAP